MDFQQHVQVIEAAGVEGEFVPPRELPEVICEAQALTLWMQALEDSIDGEFVAPEKTLRRACG